MDIRPDNVFLLIAGGIIERHICPEDSKRVSGHQGWAVMCYATVMETTTDQSSKCTYLYIPRPALLKSLEDDSQRALVRLFKLLHRQIFAKRWIALVGSRQVYVKSISGFEPAIIRKHLHSFKLRGTKTNKLNGR